MPRTIARRGYNILLTPQELTLAEILIKNGVNVVWSAAEGVYTDTGLTNIATDGNDVAGWKEQGGANYSLIETTNKPVLDIDGINSTPANQFVRANTDRLEGAISGIVANLATYNIFVVWSTNLALATIVSIYAENSSSSTTPFVAMRINNTTPGNIIFQHRDNSGTVAQISGGSGLNNNLPHLAIVRRITNNSWSFRVDGTELGTSSNNPGITNVDRVCVGYQHPTTFTQDFFEGRIAIIAIAYTDIYTTIEPILANYYNITLA